MEKKIRIQLFTEDGAIISDRLVSQGSEFYSGPKEAHEGPIRIEFTLTEKRDIEDAKLYLDKLTGGLPLSDTVKKKTTKPINDFDSREDILSKIEDNFTSNQDELMKYLRENGFVFITTEFLELSKDNFPVKDVHKDFQWMIKRIREARNPRNDRFDPMLAFGVHLFEPDEKVVVYLNGTFNKSIKVPLSSNPKEVVKKSGILKFPKYMTHEERDKFRVEFRILSNDEEREPSKFFIRWAKWVENLPEQMVEKVSKSKEE